MLSRRRCCCGGSDVFCDECEACGGVELISGGTVTDANGTWHLNRLPSGILVSSSSPTFTVFPTWTGAATYRDACVIASGRYKYEVICVDGQIGVSLYTPVVGVCLADPTKCGYRVGVIANTALPTLLFQAQIMEHTCGEGVITGTVNFNSTTAGSPCPAAIAPPSASATFSIATYSAPPRPQVCCNPCALPKADITLSWANFDDGPGEATLIYDGTTWATDCGAPGAVIRGLLECQDGQLRLRVSRCADDESAYCSYPAETGGTLDLEIGYTCRPLHMHFPVTDCGLSSYGYSDFYLDEI